MKIVNVVAAIIKSGDRIFATQRGYGEFEGGWEFPGGKIEPGEMPEEALVREIKEELAVDVRVGEMLCCVEHDYETFHLSMKCYVCELSDSEPQLLEHKAACWLTKNQLSCVDWLPADVKVIDEIRRCGIV